MWEGKRSHYYMHIAPVMLSSKYRTHTHTHTHMYKQTHKHRQTHTHMHTQITSITIYRHTLHHTIGGERMLQVIGCCLSSVVCGLTHVMLFPPKQFCNRLVSFEFLYNMSGFCKWNKMLTHSNSICINKIQSNVDMISK